MYQRYPDREMVLFTEKEEKEKIAAYFAARKKKNWSEALTLQNEIVQANIRLVMTIAKVYRNRGVDFWDLVQEGVFGIYHAIEKFEPERDYKFSTYAHGWIRQSVLLAVIDQARLVKVPPHVYHLLHKIEKIKVELLSQFQEPTLERIVDLVDDNIIKLNKKLKDAIERQQPKKIKTIKRKLDNARVLSLPRIEKYMALVSQELTISLNNPLNEEGLTLEEFLAIDSENLITENPFTSIFSEDLQKVFDKVFDEDLTLMEQKTIRMRFEITRRLGEKI